MEMSWRNSIHVNAPVEEVYLYLADLPRHAGWSQTVERLDLIQPGDSRGVGAKYLTYERQAFQSDRKPGEPLTKGFKGKTIAEVRELEPHKRIAWHSHPKPKMGVHSDWAFDLAPAEDGGTQITQSCRFQQNLFATFLAKVIFRMKEEQAVAQYDASLRNIKQVIEASMAREPQRTTIAV
jgi:uncharacterized membrane protein